MLTINSQRLLCNLIKFHVVKRKLMKLCCSLCKILRWFLIADDNHRAGYQSNLQFIDSQMYWFIFINRLQYVFQGRNPVWGARVAQWWEHSPPTNLARVRILASTPYVGWVCCWFSPLLREVFLRVLRFSPLLKNQHFQIPIRPGIR